MDEWLLKQGASDVLAPCLSDLCILFCIIFLITQSDKDVYSYFTDGGTEMPTAMEQR